MHFQQYNASSVSNVIFALGKFVPPAILDPVGFGPCAIGLSTNMLMFSRCKIYHGGLTQP